jgi:hypothetical protein
MLTALLLTALSILPNDSVARESCACIERNWFFNHEGGLVFVQIIFREEDGHVRAWRMSKENAALEIYRDWNRQGWSMFWTDGGTIRDVWAPSFIETFSQEDPEVADRALVPTDKRRGLRPR